MVFLLLGAVHEHKAHIHATEAIWNSVSLVLDKHALFNKSPNYTPLAGTDKASSKYFRLMKAFKKKYGEPTTNISGLPGQFTREQEFLFKLLQEKTTSEAQIESEKNASRDLHQKFRKQDLTHGLEAGHGREDGEDAEDEDRVDDIDDDNNDDMQRPKRKRAKRNPGGVQESVEFSEYKKIIQDRARIRDEERKERLQREAAAREEAADYNRRAEERQIKSLEVTSRLLENSAIQTAALAKLLERSL